LSRAVPTKIAFVAGTDSALLFHPFAESMRIFGPAVMPAAVFSIRLDTQ
jgi:hypothetical protein